MKHPALLLSLLLFAGCGDETTPTNGGGGDGSYFPVTVGSRWVYLETDNVGSKPDQTDVKEIVATEDLGGDSTLVMVSTPSISQIVKRFNWTVTNERVDRRRAEDYLDSVDGVLVQEHNYEPGFPRFIHSLTKLGDSFTDTIEHECIAVPSTSTSCGGLPTELEIRDYTWTVEAVDEVITVPAGTFSCIKIRRQRAFGNYKEYWFARGVGKVFERGPVNDEALTEYRIGD